MRPDWRLCPPEVVEDFKAYILEGRPLGDFLEAVVADKLVEAFGLADENNCEAMPHIAAWVYHHMPIALRGPENYRKHLQHHAILRSRADEKGKD